MAQADAATLQALEALNRAYRDKFGFVFIVCATGKSADEMLALLRARIDNPAETELRDRRRRAGQDHPPATGEAGAMKPPPSSPITSHVLDTALGRPARDLAVRLDVLDEGGAWRTLAERVTGDDGRVADLLAARRRCEARTYRLTFETGAYFAASGRPAFYPRVEVTFDVAAPGEHYHIPLLISPFGYSTYRGS